MYKITKIMHHKCVVVVNKNHAINSHIDDNLLKIKLKQINMYAQQYIQTAEKTKPIHRFFFG